MNPSAPMSAIPIAEILTIVVYSCLSGFLVTRRTRLHSRMNAFSSSSFPGIGEPMFFTC